MNKKIHPGQIFKQLLKARGMTMAEFSKRTKFNQPTVYRIVSGDTEDPRLSSLQIIADFFNISLDQLIGKAPITPAEMIGTNVEPGPTTKGLVPLISWIQAGSWGEMEEHYVDAGIDEFYPCPISHGANTYCLRVRGDSMTSSHGRSYPDGALIYIDPDQGGGVSTGDRVIAKINGDNMATFKIYINEGRKPFLKPLNPQYPIITDEFQIIGKVIGMWMD